MKKPTLLTACDGASGFSIRRSPDGGRPRRCSRTSPRSEAMWSALQENVVDIPYYGSPMGFLHFEDIASVEDPCEWLGARALTNRDFVVKYAVGLTTVEVFSLFDHEHLWRAQESPGCAIGGRKFSRRAEICEKDGISRVPLAVRRGNLDGGST